jgi:hypothetical protein
MHRLWRIPESHLDQWPKAVKGALGVDRLAPFNRSSVLLVQSSAQTSEDNEVLGGYTP